MKEDQEEIKVAKKLFIWFLVIVFAISATTWFLSRTIMTVETGILRYEEYTEMYQTCQKLNNLKDLMSKIK